MTDELDLAPIEARWEATTPGKWEQAGQSVRTLGSQGHLPSGAYAPNAYGGGICNCLGGGYPSKKGDKVNMQARANAAWFVAAHDTDVPVLIAEVKRLRALLEKREGEPYEVMRVRLAAVLKENDELRADAERKVEP